jgi:hypothetical protein
MKIGTSCGHRLRSHRCELRESDEALEGLPLGGDRGPWLNLLGAFVDSGARSNATEEYAESGTRWGGSSF